MVMAGAGGAGGGGSLREGGGRYTTTGAGGCDVSSSSSSSSSSRLEADACTVNDARCSSQFFKTPAYTGSEATIRRAFFKVSNCVERTTTSVRRNSASALALARALCATRRLDTLQLEKSSRCNTRQEEINYKKKMMDETLLIWDMSGNGNCK